MMADRPDETDLALDAIDEAFKRAVGQCYVDLTTFGVAPIRTFDDALGQATRTFQNARRALKAAIAIVTAPAAPPSLL